MPRKRAEIKVKQLPGGFGAPRFNPSPPILPPLTGLLFHLMQSVMQGCGERRIMRIDPIDKVNRFLYGNGFVENMPQTHLFL